MFLQFKSVIQPLVNQAGRKIVLALSGGVDSRVLLHLLALYQKDNPDINCIAVHVHHGLSTNADAWANQCVAWGTHYGIEIKIERITLELGNQINTEQEARNKRYQALEKYVNDGDLLLTGQHATDQIETFLLALKRGSGPKGLSAMPELVPFGQGFMVRPLLSISRENIEQFARDEQLDWVEDESNQDTKYDRNFLRKQIVPKLKERWPEIERSVLRSAKLCADQERLLKDLLQETLKKCLLSDNSLSIDVLSKQSDLARNQLIRMWLEQESLLMPSLKQLTLIWQEVALAREDANPKLLINGGEIRRYQNKLYSMVAFQDVSHWQSELVVNQPLSLPDNLGTLTLNNKVSGDGIGLRAPSDNEQVQVMFNPMGLSAHPSDRNHSRKLKKLFQEYDVPSWLRKRTPIIMYGDQIAMVVGVFVDTSCKGDDCEIVWNKV